MVDSQNQPGGDVAGNVPPRRARPVYMDMEGEFRIPLPQIEVWQALNDAELLRASLQGCDRLVREGDDVFKGSIVPTIGPARAKFVGQATLSKIDMPNSYMLNGNGSAGPAGTVRGNLAVKLAAEGDETILHYEIRVKVTGRLASFGLRMVQMTARKMAAGFFENFVLQLQAAGPESPEEPLAADELAAMVAVETRPPRRTAWLVWGATLLVLVALAAHWKGFI